MVKVVDPSAATVVEASTALVTDAFEVLDVVGVPRVSAAVPVFSMVRTSVVELPPTGFGEIVSVPPSATDEAASSLTFISGPLTAAAQPEEVEKVSVELQATNV